LAQVIPGERRQEAIERCRAREVDLPIRVGSDAAWELVGGGIGLLVLEGLLLRRVGIEGRFGAELLGEGDLLRPWQDDQNSPMLPLETGWSVVSPARAAILDDAFVRSMGDYPELATSFVARATQRSRSLAVQIAIVHQARVDVRVHMLLWHLAGRWGRVRRDATLLPVRLTHLALAELVAARRQTVTSALSDLTCRGLVRQSGNGWLLFGEPPTELLRFDIGRGTSVQACAERPDDRDAAPCT
jgi:hypothetical protein